MFMSTFASSTEVVAAFSKMGGHLWLGEKTPSELIIEK
jgi:hypothetical protein